MHIPLSISISFLTLSIFFFVVLFSFFLFASRDNQSHRNKVYVFFAAYLIFLVVQAILSIKGVFMDFQALPPKIFLLPFANLILLIVLFRLKVFKELLQRIPTAWVMYLQGFRIIVEIILWQLFVHKVIPVQMTFEGYNFDVVAGIIMPLTAFIVYKKQWVSPRFGYITNTIGLVLIFTIFFIAITSTPSPLHLPWADATMNRMITVFPMVWLPGFLAPMAIILHFISIYQIKASYKRYNS